MSLGPFNPLGNFSLAPPTRFVNAIFELMKNEPQHIYKNNLEIVVNNIGGKIAATEMWDPETGLVRKEYICQTG